MQAVQFSTEKPKVAAVRVVAVDVETGKSRSTTVYNTTPERFIEALKGDKPKGQRRPQKQSA